MTGPIEVPETDGGLIVHFRPGGTLVLAFSADVAPEQVRKVVEQIAAGSPDARVIALADVTAVRAWHPDDAPAELAALRELLDEIGVMAANAPEDGDSFALLEEIAMRIVSAGLPR